MSAAPDLMARIAEQEAEIARLRAERDDATREANHQNDLMLRVQAEHDEAHVEIAEHRAAMRDMRRRKEVAEQRLAAVRALAEPNGVWKGEKHVRLTRRDPRLGCEITESYVRVADLRAVLDAPQPEEADR